MPSQPATSTSATAKPLVIAIMGPTASGKTAAALEIARHIPSEIISVDSALVYRGMDIGTAKSSRDELAAAPHYLIDIMEPTNPAGGSATTPACRRNPWRGKLVLMIDGTIAYFAGATARRLPQADRHCARLDASRHRRAGMHAKLAQLDPSAARLKPNDSRRISAPWKCLVSSL